VVELTVWVQTADCAHRARYHQRFYFLSYVTVKHTALSRHVVFLYKYTDFSVSRPSKGR
jgi:hypothetical protein